MPTRGYISYSLKDLKVLVSSIKREIGPQINFAHLMTKENGSNIISIKVHEYTTMIFYHFYKGKQLL